MVSGMHRVRKEEKRRYGSDGIGSIIFMMIMIVIDTSIISIIIRLNIIMSVNRPSGIIQHFPDM